MNRAAADRDLRRVECLVAPAQGTPWALAWLRLRATVRHARSKIPHFVKAEALVLVASEIDISDSRVLHGRGEHLIAA